MKILVTGAAGFIGSKLMHELARRGDSVVGIDNYDNYYDVRLKRARVAAFGLDVLNLDITDKPALDALFAGEHFEKVVNLAAQTGVRYSVENPYVFLRSNVTGFLNVLEACRNYGVKHLVFASSSSVYGSNTKVPFREDDELDKPMSLYAVTKRNDELMSRVYAALYGIAITGLRYFTAYGPWGRPDMAPMLFARCISRGETLQIFNHGDMIRDFTFIDDIVEGTMRCIDNEPARDEDGLRYRVYNIGCGHPVRLMDFIAELEHAFGIEAHKAFHPMQPGDVYQTTADTTLLQQEQGFKPSVPLCEGIAKFVAWYKNFFTFFPD